MADLFRAAAQRAATYLGTARERGVWPTAEAVAALDELDQPCPDQPIAAETLLEELDRFGSPATVATTGGRYFGFVNGSGIPGALAASVLISAWNQNAALRVMSPAGAVFEDVALRWVKELLGLPPESSGAVVTGASAANFTCLAAARHALLARAGWDVERDGLFGAPPLTVVAGAEVHIAVLKALGLLGLGRDRVVRVPVDGQGRMRAEALPPLDDRTIVCMQAGNVNTGAFDPATEICRARAAGAWVHVDGAFGLWAAVSPRLRHLTTGYELADSWATDAHKWPNSVYDCGIALVREPVHLRAAMSAISSYFAPTERREPSQFTPEMSRRARGADLWATLRLLGRNGLSELVERSCAHARRFAAELKRHGCEILNDVVLNQVLVSFGTPEVARAVIERVQSDGVCWCGGTQWQGRTAMRISVSSWATTAEHVEMSVAAIVRARERCETERGRRLA